MCLNWSDGMGRLWPSRTWTTAVMEWDTWTCKGEGGEGEGEGKGSRKEGRLNNGR